MLANMPRAAADPGPPCPREELLAMVAKAKGPAQLPPRYSKGAHGPLIAISLHETMPGTDQLQFAAMVDVDSAQVWVHRYGGFVGTHDWFGPVPLELARLAGCPPAKGLLWLGEDRVLSSKLGGKSITITEIQER